MASMASMAMLSRRQQPLNLSALEREAEAGAATATETVAFFFR